MKIEALEIAGAFSIKPNLLGDTRGTFARLYCDDTFTAHGLNTLWVQMNTSRTTSKGAIRGMHFQRPPYSEVKLVRAVTGDVVDVIVDLRDGSETFGKSIKVELASAAMEAIYVPQGCAHGFQALTDHAELHYLHSAPYSPDYEGGVNHADPALDIGWPLPMTECSQRDLDLPYLNEIERIEI